MRNFALVGIGLATLLLALAYALNDSLIWALAITALGLFWLMGQWRSRAWVGSVGLSAFVGATAFGIWLGLPAGWMLVSIVATLVAWDLDDFSLRLGSVEHIGGEVHLKRSHLQRLLVTASFGLLLGVVALSIQLDLAFGWALLLGLLAIFCLGQAFRLLRQESD